MCSPRGARYEPRTGEQVRAVFTLAWKLQPCIIFIDEIDAFLRERKARRCICAHGTDFDLTRRWMDGWREISDGDRRGMRPCGWVAGPERGLGLARATSRPALPSLRAYLP
jgi:hypothetical protein